MSRKKCIHRLIINTHYSSKYLCINFIFKKKKTNLLSRYRLFYSKPTFLLICRICYNRGNPWSVQRAGNNDKCGVPPKSCELAWSLHTRRFVPSLHSSIELVYVCPSLPLYSFFNPFTGKCGQRKVSTKFPNFIFQNCEKQIASCESTGRELSFEWSHRRISSTDSNVRVTLQNPIKESGSERVKMKKIQNSGF